MVGDSIRGQLNERHTDDYSKYECPNCFAYIELRNGWSEHNAGAVAKRIHLPALAKEVKTCQTSRP